MFQDINKIENLLFKVVPLKLNELSLLAYDINNLEESLGYKYNYYPINNDMKNFFKTQIRSVLKNSNDFHYYTTWLIISKPFNEIIGFFSFKDYSKKKRKIYATISVNSAYTNLDNSFNNLILDYLINNIIFDKLVVETNCPNLDIYKGYGFTIKDANLFTSSFEKKNG